MQGSPYIHALHAQGAYNSTLPIVIVLCGMKYPVHLAYCLQRELVVYMNTQSPIHVPSLALFSQEFDRGHMDHSIAMSSASPKAGESRQLFFYPSASCLSLLGPDSASLQYG